MSVLSLLAQLRVPRSSIGYETNITSNADPLESILNLVYMAAGIVAVIVLIMAGYLFVTSRGDPAQMKRSKDAIRGAVIGLIVVATAFILTQFILGGLSS